MILPVNVNYVKTVMWYRSQYTLKRKHLLIGKDSVGQLYKDKHFLVLNKPFDLILYDYGKNNPNQLSMFDLIKEKYPFYYDPVIVYFIF